MDNIPEKKVLEMSFFKFFSFFAGALVLGFISRSVDDIRSLVSTHYAVATLDGRVGTLEKSTVSNEVFLEVVRRMEEQNAQRKEENQEIKAMLNTLISRQ